MSENITLELWYSHAQIICDQNIERDFQLQQLRRRRFRKPFEIFAIADQVSRKSPRYLIIIPYKLRRDTEQLAPRYLFVTHNVQFIRPESRYAPKTYDAAGFRQRRFFFFRELDDPPRRGGVNLESGITTLALSLAHWPTRFPELV